MNKVIFTKVALNVEDYSINIYVKTNSNIPSLTTENANFHFFYKSMETSSCHSNQSSYPIEIKTYMYMNFFSMNFQFHVAL